MKFGICSLSCVPLRAAPNQVSEMTSQLLFGEVFEAFEQAGHFHRVRVAHDGYEGWMDSRQGEEISEDDFAEISGRKPVLLRDIVSQIVLPKRTVAITRGATLPGFRGDAIGWGKTAIPFAGQVVTCPPSAKALVEFARLYLGAPYLWGGRSPFGIDCSGFAQIVFRAFGVALPRDSLQQRKLGESVSLADALPGDLAFFSDALDRRSHVGLVTPGGIIHASALVREDDLDTKGIRRREDGQCSHRLAEVRRVASWDG